MDNRKSVKFLFLITVLLTFACSTSKNNLSTQVRTYSPASKDLYDEIAHMDGVFFNAFNTRDIDLLKTLLSDDLEFYHDHGGKTNFSQNIESFKKTFESERRLRRELVPGTLEVYPIKDYGAVQMGIHRFYGTEKGEKEKLGGEAKFIHVWHKKDGAWQITRIIS